MDGRAFPSNICESQGDPCTDRDLGNFLPFYYTGPGYCISDFFLFPVFCGTVTAVNNLHSSLEKTPFTSFFGPFASCYIEYHVCHGERSVYQFERFSRVARSDIGHNIARDKIGRVDRDDKGTND